MQMFHAPFRYTFNFAFRYPFEPTFALFSTVSVPHEQDMCRLESQFFPLDLVKLSSCMITTTPCNLTTTGIFTNLFCDISPGSGC